MNEKLTTLVKKTGLEQAKQDALLSQFSSFLEQVDEVGKVAMAIKVTHINQDDEMKEAREKRLAIRQIRIKTENRRKELKEASQTEGRAIDSMAKMIMGAVEPIEKHLMEQEKFVENLAREQKEKMVAERTEKLELYVDDVAMYNFKDLKTIEFDHLLETCKLAKEAKEKESEELAKKEKTDKEAKDKLELENAELKKKVDAKETELKAERKKTEDADKERIRLVNEKQQEEAKKLEAERVEQEKVDKAVREAKLAPDKEKLMAFARSIGNLSAPTGMSEDAQKIVSEASLALMQVMEDVKSKAENL